MCLSARNDTGAVSLGPYLTSFKLLLLEWEVSHQTSLIACQSQLAVVAKCGSIQSGIPQSYLIHQTSEMAVIRHGVRVCTVHDTTCSYLEVIVIECGHIA